MDAPFDRRDFLKTAAGTLSLLLSRQGLRPRRRRRHRRDSRGPRRRFGVIGLGVWGREILAALGRTSSAQVAWTLRLYDPALKRAAASGAPGDA